LNTVIDYAYFLKEAIENVEKDRSFLAFEKSASDFLIQILKPAKYLSFGPEPVLAYYFARVNEINLIRLIILAKLNNVSGELVKERLNGVYA
jgi:V/A-type H+-transporting ATPase subunit C